MENRVDDHKVDGGPASIVREGGTLVEQKMVTGLRVSERCSGARAQVVEQLTPVVVTDKKRKRKRQTKTLAYKHHPAPKSMKEEEEEVCFICFDGGSLVLCDRKGCPKAYHPACIKRDEAFFQSKAKWDCGWHLCSVCEKKASHYMCYTCTYSLCKQCSKIADYACVRGNKGFCTICMKIILMIENKDAGNMESIQVDFDDKTSWEYLFKMYWSLLKGKFSLSVDELMQAKNPHAEAIGTDFNQQTPVMDKSTRGIAVSILPKSRKHSEQDPCRRVTRTNVKRQISEKDNSTEAVAAPILPKSSEHLEQTALQDPHQSPDLCSFSAKISSSEKRKISDVRNEWGSKELLELVAHMKNGDSSILSQSDVQALLMDYIKKNNLRDPRVKSQIVCDLRLKLLFGKPRVGHLEMLKLLEYHYLRKEDTPKNATIPRGIDGCTGHVGDDQNDDSVSNQSKRQKTRKRGEESTPQVNVNEYAAIDAHNINLIFLRRSALENLIDEVEKFHEKVVGSVVRIRVSCNDQGQDFYRLVRVVGTSEGAEPYKLGFKTTDIMIEVLNLDKKETLSIDAVSNQVFTEDECRHLYQSIKSGILKPLTVGDVLIKAMALQALRFDDWLIGEILRLSHLRDKADEMGRKNEHRECVEKLKLLRTPEVRHQKLTETPEVHVDPMMNPNHQSEEDTSKNDKQTAELPKLGVNGDHTLQSRKCVEENEATIAQPLQQKRDDGDGSNSSLGHRLRPRKNVKENKTTSAQRVQPKRGTGGSISIQKEENHVSPGGSSNVAVNQSVVRPNSEIATVAPTIRVQPKRDGRGSSSIQKEENHVSPGGSSNVVNQSVVRPDSEITKMSPVSTIRVQPKRDGRGSSSFPKQENDVSQGCSSSVVGKQSVLRPESETRTVTPSSIQVQQKRDKTGSNSIVKKENHVSPDVGGSTSVLGNQSVVRPDSETATVSMIRVQPKRDGGTSNRILKQENHVSLGGSSSVVGNQSVRGPGSETATVAPVSKIRVQPKRDGGRSKSFPKQENQLTPGCSSNVSNQSVLSPDSATAKVPPISKIRVLRIKSGASSNCSPKQENHVFQGGSSIVNGTQSVLNTDSENATAAPVSGIHVQQTRGGGGSNSSLQQDNHVSPGSGFSSVDGNQSVSRPDSETAMVAPVSGASLLTNNTQMENVWHYRDPNGKIQGPFSIAQLQKWNTTGYFPLDMRIWTDNEQDHSIVLSNALAGDFCRDSSCNAAWEGLDSHTSDCSAYALVKENQPEVIHCSDLLKDVPASSEHPVVCNNNLETCADPLNQVTKHGAEELNDAGVNEHPDEAPLHESFGMESGVVGVNEHPNEAPMHHSPSIENKNAGGVNVHPDLAPPRMQYLPSIEGKDAGVNEHPDEAPLHRSPDMESKNVGVNKYLNEAPLHHSPERERKNTGVNEHPIKALLHHSLSIECEDACVNEHPNEASLHHLLNTECEDPIVNEHPNKAPLYLSPSLESENAGVNEHPNEAPLLYSPGTQSKEMSSMNQNCVSSGQIRPQILLDLDLNNKDCNPASSLTNLNESPENIVDLDLVNLPSSAPKTGYWNSDSQLIKQDSMSIDIQAAELLRSLSGYVNVNGMTISDVQAPAKNEMDDDLHIPISKASDSDNGDLRNPEQKLSDVTQFAQSDENRLGESDDGPCKTLMNELGWSKASSQVVGGGAQVQETTAGVWTSSPARNEPSCKEWDFGLVPMSSLPHSDAVSGDEVATTTPNGTRHLLLDLSSWPAGINEPIEFNTLAEESVSDLLAEVDAMESKSDLPSPSSAMRCGDDLIDKNDCFSSIEELSPTPDAGKSDAVSSDPGIPPQPTEIHGPDPEPIGASQVSACDPSKRSTTHSTTSSGAETKSDVHPINFWESGPDIHPPATVQPVVNAPPPNHVSASDPLIKSTHSNTNSGAETKSVVYPINFWESGPPDFQPPAPGTVNQQPMVNAPPPNHVSACDPLKGSTAHSTTNSVAETKSVVYPINFWESGPPDFQPPAPGTLNQQPMVNALPPNHVWGAVQGNVGWAGPPPLPPPQAFANMGWRPTIGTTAPWVNSNLSLGAYNGNGGWDSPLRFSGSRDYGVQSRDMGFGRGGRPTWNRQQHGGGGGGGGHSRPSPKGQRVCKFYESGHCKRGSSCAYLHP